LFFGPSEICLLFCRLYQNKQQTKIPGWHDACRHQEHVKTEKGAAMRGNRERWMELCAQATNEQDSRKLMALIQQITALLDAKQTRLIEKDSQGLKSETNC
jgi:hypothetical protein